MKPRTCAAICGILTLALWVIGSSRALAGDCTATLTWTAPTTFTDGSALNPSTDLSGYNVYKSTDGGSTWPTKFAVTDPAATKYVDGSPVYGETDTYAVSAIGKNGVESAKSNSATKACVDMRQPSPPSLLDLVLAFLKRLFGWFS